MLPRDQRLRSARDFRRVYRRGRSFAHPMLVLHMHPTRDGSRRVGFSVSRKLGGAVQRNLLKRRLREAVRIVLPSTGAGFAAVIVGRPALRAAAFVEVAAAVRDVFAAAGRLPDEDGLEGGPCAASASR